MARTPIRTTSLIIDDINLMLNLFGNVANAHRQLGLESIVQYPHFYRAMHFQTIIPKHKEDIEEAWNRWKTLYLRPEVPGYSDLKVDMENRDEWPKWHPYAKAKKAGK